ncbi:MAG: PhoPQ-activated pathogenicity-like protein PqaA type [Draconibacterium sp.]|nr:MAG: PhoPQ-activated pathogenicity-like protein PqaA type [Draconibacterium sp.]
MKHLKMSVFIIVLLSLILSCQKKSEPVTPENALQSYLNNGDNSFSWEVNDKVKAEGVTVYRIIFTSQVWRDIKWKHELTVMVPDDIQYDDALLFITGGSIKNGEPRIHQWDKAEIQSLSKIAQINKAITSIIWQVPNQPLYDGLTEDALISFTLHNFQNDHDYSWPLLFPMTKSAIRAMDVVQLFAKKEFNKNIEGFVVSGASKRGWTTWLTGANDKRVKAIGPIVIDVLNMPLSVDYHLKAWGDYSIQIEDYVKLGIAQQLGTPDGDILAQMIDPYSYRKTLTMPKMIFIGTNDEYWPVDAIKHYIDSIPGENYICYAPDAGHGMGNKAKALKTLSAFFGNTISTGTYPICNYSIKEDNKKVTISVSDTPELLKKAVLWFTTSTDRDFRDEKWQSIDLGHAGEESFTVDVTYPDEGYKAFFVDLKYKSPFAGDFTESTRMYVTNTKELLLAGE